MMNWWENGCVCKWLSSYFVPSQFIAKAMTSIVATVSSFLRKPVYFVEAWCLGDI
jgi:hypothetical protein